MAGLTFLEREAIKAILAEAGELAEADREELLGAAALSRENSGGGFFTELAFPTKANGTSRHLGENVWISIEGLKHGLGMILHLEMGRPPLLEGYAVGGEDTSKIDFEQVRFAVSAWPKPFLENGS
jgi:hypothetical protein